MKRIIPLALMLALIFGQCTSQKTKEKLADYSSVRQTATGRAVNVVLTTYTTTMLADGKDQTNIRVFVSDSAGREITTANLPIDIIVTGDGHIEKVKDGPDLAMLKSMEDNKTTWVSSIVNGSCTLIFKAGVKPDRVKVEVKSGLLWPGSHEIHTIDPKFKMMKPSADQVKPVMKNIGKGIGADISFLPQIESRGRKFKDNGVETDLMKILADNGFNYIRLRVFVNPENEKGYSPGAGFCGLKYTKEMALRAKKYGMKLLLNFHYSDYWADPQQQNIPLAWSNLDFKTLKDSVKAYTKRVLIGLKDQGTLPEMVQVGNEINHGMLWPDGHISNPDNLAELLKAGVEGVREVDPSIIVMMHIALGGQNREATFWLDNMIARGVDFDIIGLSYYPRWHGTLDDLNFNLNDLIKRYNKDVNVVEYSQFKKEVHDIVFGLPGNRGEGTNIWEPINSFFDKDGNPTADLKIYNEISKKYPVK